MKRIVRLTESDLVKLVKRVIKEQTQTQIPTEFAGARVINMTQVPDANYTNAFKGPYMSQTEGGLIAQKFPSNLEQVYIYDKTSQKFANAEDLKQVLRVAYQVKKEFSIVEGNSPIILPVNSFLKTCDSRVEQCPSRIQGSGVTVSIDPRGSGKTERVAFS